MTRSQSDSEVRDAYVNQMGNDLGELFHVAANELQLLIWKWEQFKSLFVDRESRVDLLNAVASNFFSLAQEVFIDDIILGITRLAGPVKSSGKDNLSMRQLIALIVDVQIRSELETRIRKVEDDSAFAKDPRNRHIAHRDLDVALNRHAIPLPKVTATHIQDALDSMVEAMNYLQVQTCRSTTMYWNAPIAGDAVDLLYALNDGLSYERLRLQSELKGPPLPEDPDRYEI